MYNNLNDYIKEKLQGMTEDRSPVSQKPINPQITELSAIEKKILSTLYKYQNQSFPNDRIKRWTFTVKPNAIMEYPDYLNGVATLLKKGLIAVVVETYQCYLTNDGLDFIKNNLSIYDERNIYQF